MKSLINRDPRMEQTFMKPGTQEVGIAEAHRPSLNLGGYPQIKFRPLTIDQMEWGNLIRTYLSFAMRKFY